MFLIYTDLPNLCICTFVLVGVGAARAAGIQMIALKLHVCVKITVIFQHVQKCI